MSGHTLALLVSSFTIASLAVPAFSQTAPVRTELSTANTGGAELDEIIVTAERSEQGTQRLGVNIAPPKTYGVHGSVKF